MVGTSYLEIELRDGIVCCGDIGIEVGLGNVFGKNLSLFLKTSVLSQRSCELYVPWVEKIAAKIGFASSNVSGFLAMKACKKARLLLLYWVSSASAILRLDLGMRKPLEWCECSSER